MSLVTNNDSNLSAKTTKKIMALLNHILGYEGPFLQMASSSCKHLFHLFSKGCLQGFILFYFILFFFFLGGGIRYFLKDIRFCDTSISFNPQILANYTDLWYSAQNSHLFFLRFCANCTCQSIFKLRRKNRITLKHILHIMVLQFDENVWGYTNSPDWYQWLWTV